MSDIRVCRVQNKVDGSNLEDLVVCSIWESASLKVYIVKNNSTIFFGEEERKGLEKFANTFKKTLEVYIEESKEIFSGTKDDIDFLLTDCLFFWKRKTQRLGKVEVKPSQDLEIITCFVLKLMNAYSKNKILLDDIQKDHQSVKISHSEILKKLNEFQCIKEQLEDGLYKKFILVLNSKKAKIRALKDQLNKLKNNKNIFDEATDESEGELEEKNNKPSHLNQEKALKKNGNEKSGIKRKRTNVGNNIQAIKRNDSKKNVLINISNNIEPIPSTSSDTKNQDDEETPDLLSGESECDLELKCEDEIEDSKVKDSAIIEADSEEEMFGEE